MASNRPTVNALRLLTKHARSGFFPQVSRCLSSTSQMMKGDGPPKEVWALGKLNHLAVAVPNLEKSMAFYRDVLGAVVSEPHPQEEHGVYTVFVDLGNTKIELLYPLGENSPIKNFLEKNKAGGMHHICIEVKNINEAMKELKKAGVRLLSKEAKIGAHGKPVVFLHPKDCNGVLTELEEQ